MLKNKVLIFCLFLFLILGVEQAYSQCSMCRAVLQSEEGQATAKGINNGIIYLMAIPYLLVAFVGYQIFKLIKK